MEPLAVKLRPNDTSEVIGQQHLLGENKILKNMVNNKRLFSMILYGKPGIGKTTIALAMVNELKLRYRLLNAVINNKKDFDTVVEEAKMYNGIVVIMDEIHRLNKDKQDLLLPYLESGLITLIGLTTSNPYFKINPAIRSRCQIFELKELSTDDVTLGIEKAIKTEFLKDISIDNESIYFIAKMSNGDLRYAYNLLEVAYYSAPNFKVDVTLLKNIIGKPNLAGDKNETDHYDLLSAFQKSIRGSDVDAALHYLARLIEIGDYESIYRRMSVIGYEDIGLANPSIGPRIVACIDTCERVGFPELIIPLGVMIVDMALSPKSNSGYLAINKALNDVRSGLTGPIPDNIKINTTTYLYPHDYPNSYVKQNYMPDKLKGYRYYYPKSNKYEETLKNIYDKLKNTK